MEQKIYTNEELADAYLSVQSFGSRLSRSSYTDISKRILRSKVDFFSFYQEHGTLASL